VARGRTNFCAAHGGGIRCKVEGCNKAAVGKFQMCRMHAGYPKKRASEPIITTNFDDNRAAKKRLVVSGAANPLAPQQPTPMTMASPGTTIQPPPTATTIQLPPPPHHHHHHHPPPPHPHPHPFQQTTI